MVNAPFRTRDAVVDRTYWHPLGIHAAADMGARIEPLQHGHEVWHMGDATMLVRVIDGVPHGLDVCGQPDGPIAVPTWIEPRGHFVAAEIERRELPPIDWAHEQYLRELAAERRAVDREEARDYQRRSWREKSFQIE